MVRWREKGERQVGSRQERLQQQQHVYVCMRSTAEVWEQDRAGCVASAHIPQPLPASCAEHI